VLVNLLQITGSFEKKTKKNPANLKLVCRGLKIIIQRAMPLPTSVTICITATPVDAAPAGNECDSNLTHNLFGVCRKMNVFAESPSL